MERINFAEETLLELDALKAHSKCLISGGYFIVLDDYKGLVLATEDYFTCRIVKSRQEEKNNGKKILSISSPQFPGANKIDIDFQDTYAVEEYLQNHPNKYLCIPVMLALQYYRITQPEKYKEIIDGVKIEIFETKGYINSVHHKEATEVEGVPIGPNFLNFDAEVTECAKTGLGSSSGVIVILIKAII